MADPVDSQNIPKIDPGDYTEFVGKDREWWDGLDAEQQWEWGNLIRSKYQQWYLRNRVGSQGGHKPVSPGDMSGTDPTDVPIPQGKIAPALAGARSAALRVIGTIAKFIDMYADKYGYEHYTAPKNTKKSEENPSSLDAYYREKYGFAPQRSGVPAAPPKAIDTDTGKEVPHKSKDVPYNRQKMLDLLFKIPEGPTQDVQQWAQAIQKGIDAISSNRRAEISKRARKEFERHENEYRAEFKKQWYANKRKKGEGYSEEQFDMDWESERAQDTHRQAEVFRKIHEKIGEKFERNATAVRGNLNKLANAVGTLRRSGGFGSKADQTFLQKYVKFGSEGEGENKRWFTTVEIQPRAATDRVHPKFADIAGPEAPTRQERARMRKAAADAEKQAKRMGTGSSGGRGAKIPTPEEIRQSIKWILDSTEGEDNES